MFQRQLVTQLYARVQEPRRFIQIVTGPRQTGKTTAVTQMLEQVKLPVHFVSADDPLLTSPEWLRREWDQARLFARQSPEGALFVVDEVQKVSQWSSLVKLMWDEDSRLHVPLKVILTGSSSLLLQKGLVESLMGRFEVLYSPHWNYVECREAFDYRLDDFLQFGGYPGAAPLRDEPDRWMRYMKTSVVEPTVAQDVLQMEEVRKPALLRALFFLGASYSAQEVSYTKLLGQLQDAGNTVTLAHYLELLQSAGILCGLSKFALQKIRVRKSSPRFMVFDTSLMVFAAGATSALLREDTTFRGHVVESAVGAYLLARGQEEGFDVYWWREQGSEVDFILQKGVALTAIEVKSGRIKGVGGSLAFLKQHPQAFSYIVGDSSCPLEDFLSGQFELFK